MVETYVESCQLLFTSFVYLMTVYLRTFKNKAILYNFTTIFTLKCFRVYITLLWNLQKIRLSVWEFECLLSAWKWHGLRCDRYNCKKEMTEASSIIAPIYWACSDTLTIRLEYRWPAPIRPALQLVMRNSH